MMPCLLFWFLLSQQNPLSDCYNRFEATPDGFQGPSCFFRYGRETGNWGLVYEHLSRLAEKYPNRPWIHFYLFRIQRDTGAAVSEPLIVKTLALFQKQQNFQGSCYSLMNWSSYLADTGELGLAIEKLKMARQLAESMGDQKLIWDSSMQEIPLLLRRGEPEKADMLARRLELQLFPDGPPALQAELLLGLSNAAIDLNRIDRAQAYLERLLDLACSEQNPTMEATAWFGLLRCSVEDGPPRPGDRERIVALARQALAAAQLAGHQAAEVLALSVLGNLLGERVWLERQLDLALELGMPDKICDALTNLAMISVASDPQEARSLISQALATVENLGQDQLTIFVQSNSLLVDWQTLPWEQAAAESMVTLDQIESLMNLQTADASRAGLMSRWAIPYYRLAGLLIHQSATDPRALDMAFTVSERIRARSLLDYLNYADVAKPLPGTASLLQEKAELSRRLSAQHRLLQQPEIPGESRQMVLDKMVALELDLQETEGRILSADPGFVSASRPELVNLQQVQATLRPDEAMLAFQLASERDIFGQFDGGSWLSLITQDRVLIRKLPDQSQVEPVIETILTMIPQGDNPILRGAMSGLYQRLFGDLLQELPQQTRRLIFLPDGILYRLPFDLLRAEADRQPLGILFQTEIAPSATLWARWRNQPGFSPESPALILADPVPAAGIAPTGSSVRSSWSLAGGVPLQALPHAREEGRDILKRLRHGSRFEVGAAASEDLLKADGHRYRILHFAAHAVVDHDRPERSAVVLSPGNETEDGLLQPQEIASLELDGAIVVLSTCHSASGLLFRGEGAMSLARAFMQAGASTVVATLWPLGDQDGAQFFHHFYAHLARGEDVATAAQSTRRRLYEKGVSPLAWSAVVVLGNGSERPFPGAGRTSSYFLAGLILLALLLVGLYKYTKHQKDLRRSQP